MDDGGHDAPDGRSLRYLMWTPEPAPDATAIETHFALLISEPGRPVRCERDIHTTGLFPRALWHRLIDEANLELIDLAIPDPHEGEHAVFAARKRPHS
jgi:hypothetical protein